VEWIAVAEVSEMANLMQYNFIGLRERQIRFNAAKMVETKKYDFVDSFYVICYVFSLYEE
jgi:hypothetical protein